MDSTTVNDRIECAGCCAGIDNSKDSPALRVPCPDCGATARRFVASVTESLVLREGIGVRAKRPGKKRPYIEDKAMPSFSHKRGKFVLREQIVDRDNDRYFEKVTDYETGEIIHQQEEPLSKHQGHGSEKTKRKAPGD